jgi:hypothetical protein
MIMPIHLLAGGWWLVAGGWWMVDGGHHNNSTKCSSILIYSLQK